MKFLDALWAPDAARHLLSNILADIHETIAKLEAAAEHHSWVGCDHLNEADALRDRAKLSEQLAADAHAEADKAEAVLAKLKALITP